MIDIWNIKIPRADITLIIKDGVCQLHFTPSDIHTTKVYIDSDGSEIVYPLIRPKLKLEAVRGIFPNLPSHLSSKNKKTVNPQCSKELLPSSYEDTSTELNNFLTEQSSETKDIVFIRGNDIGFETNVDSCNVDNFSQQWSPRCLLCIKGKESRCKYYSCKNKYISKTKFVSVKLSKLYNKKAQQARRLCKRVSIMKTNIISLKKSYSKLKEEKVNCLIKACSAQSGHGVRYTTNWVYECILMKIKSPASYQKMYREKILPLPSTVTLQQYIKKLKPAYGFRTSTFQMLEEKSKNIKSAERHGFLLLDEMSLSPSVTFNKSTLNVDGLIDLGKYTPKQQENELGDHALVFMYQPYQGPWIQAIGAFLNKGAAPNEGFQKLIVEAVILLEKSGFKVHNVVTDGGPWNRGTWNSFGITNTNGSCQHPMDSERRLWFISNFLHLIKTMWTRILKNKILKTQKGYIKFDKTVADCMEELLNRGEKNFIGCGPTVKFIRKINNLVDVLNSNTEKHSLQADSNSNSNKINVLYSLIKPPRGSNVSGGDILKTLIDIKPTNEEDIQKKADLEIKLDNLLDNGEFEVLSDHLYFENENQSNIDKSALTYFVGYVARNAKKHSTAKNCTTCFNSIVSSNNQNISNTDEERFINLQSEGHLFIPTENLMELIYNSETTIIHVLNNYKINKHILDHG
ncbi:hypothetical protein QTP88_006209 [Uroleucon formosanum]